MDKIAASKEKRDALFAIKITEDMEIRNLLRSGLFEAQGNHPEKIPLYISWPSWLDDGIVCVFARDLRNMVRKAVRDTAVSLAEIIGDPSDILPEDFMDDFMALPDLPQKTQQVDNVEYEFSELQTGENRETTQTEPPAEKSDFGLKEINKNNDAQKKHPQEPEEEKPLSSQDLADALFKKLKSGGK